MSMCNFFYIYFGGFWNLACMYIHICWYICIYLYTIAFVMLCVLSIQLVKNNSLYGNFILKEAWNLLVFNFLLVLYHLWNISASQKVDSRTCMQALYRFYLVVSACIIKFDRMSIACSDSILYERAWELTPFFRQISAKASYKHFLMMYPVFFAVYVITMPLIKGRGLRVESIIQNKETISKDELCLSVRINIDKICLILSC